LDLISGVADYQPMTSPTDSLTSPLCIRLATDEDAAALEELARLDSQHVPPSPLMVALSDDHYVAAMSITSGRWIADPYVVSEPAVALLRRRVVDITGRDVPRRGIRIPSMLNGLFSAVPRGV
jgi:hypothetical protein